MRGDGRPFRVHLGKVLTWGVRGKKGRGNCVLGEGKRRGKGGVTDHPGRKKGRKILEVQKKKGKKEGGGLFW